MILFQVDSTHIQIIMRTSNNGVYLRKSQKSFSLITENRICIKAIISIKRLRVPSSEVPTVAVGGGGGGEGAGCVCGGGVLDSGFQVTGVIEWGQTSKPQKIPGPDFNLKKVLCRTSLP